ncbi:uncharacterized protein LOC126835968 [Adelges cooleyi]|uniref:uncharacterized protein LOC126835968 n=1 Tax=Adelges cooleyi TaxID=133065 RepID=UPI00217FD630|nr:uncharacterized protein LOC126835968 [Adelges cooleyi]
MSNAIGAVDHKMKDQEPLREARQQLDWLVENLSVALGIQPNKNFNRQQLVNVVVGLKAQCDEARYVLQSNRAIDDVLQERDQIKDQLKGLQSNLAHVKNDNKKLVDKNQSLKMTLVTIKRKRNVQGQLKMKRLRMKNAKVQKKNAMLNKELQVVKAGLTGIVAKAAQCQSIMTDHSVLALKLERDIANMVKDDMAKEEEIAELKANLRAKSHVVRAVQAISEHHLGKAAGRIEELEAELAIVGRSMKKVNINDLLQERDQIKDQLKALESNLAHVKNGNKKLVDKNQCLKMTLVTIKRKRNVQGQLKMKRLRMKNAKVQKKNAMLNKELQVVKAGLTGIVAKAAQCQSIMTDHSGLALKLERDIANMVKDDMAKEEEIAELKANLRAKSHVVRAVQAISEHHLGKAAGRIEELQLARTNMAKEEEMAELKANLRAKSHVVRAVLAISEHHLVKATGRIEELEAKLAIVERAMELAFPSRQCKNAQKHCRLPNFII